MAGSLSGGERQILAIARALMPRPKLLLLDEPSLSLAPIVVEKVMDIIRTIRDGGTTVILPEFLRVADSLRLVLYGIALMFFIIRLPMGVWGSLKSVLLSRSPRPDEECRTGP